MDRLLGLMRCALMLAPMAVCAQDGASDGSVADLPPVLRPFLDEGMDVVLWRQADLDGDGRRDYLLVLQAPRDDAAPRVTKLLVGQRGGGLSLAALNGRLVMCRGCGGVWPDPLDEVTVGPRTFTVSHYGGSRWRWSSSWTFRYDRGQRTWMLATFTEGHDTEDSGHLVRTYRQGRHLRPVRLQDFDPERLYTHILRPGVPKPRAVPDPGRS